MPPRTPNLRTPFNTPGSRRGGLFPVDAYVAEFCAAFDQAARDVASQRMQAGERLAGWVVAELSTAHPFVALRWNRPDELGGGRPAPVTFTIKCPDGLAGLGVRPFQREDCRQARYAEPDSLEFKTLQPGRVYAPTSKLPHPSVLAQVVRPPSWAAATRMLSVAAAARLAEDKQRIDTAVVAFNRDLAAGNWDVIEGLATAAGAQDRDALRRVIDKAQSLYAQSVANRLRLSTGNPAQGEVTMASDKSTVEWDHARDQPAGENHREDDAAMNGHASSHAAGRRDALQVELSGIDRALRTYRSTNVELPWAALEVVAIAAASDDPAALNRAIEQASQVYASYIALRLKLLGGLNLSA